MNSNGIEPRVGMQVQWDMRIGGMNPLRFKIGSISKIGLICDESGSARLEAFGSRGAWDRGEVEIEWIPPTDEEREMFREASVDLWHRHESFVSEPSDWIWIESDSVQEAFANLCEWKMDQAAAIAESLSMDGL